MLSWLPVVVRSYSSPLREASSRAAHGLSAIPPARASTLCTPLTLPRLGAELKRSAIWCSRGHSRIMSCLHSSPSRSALVHLLAIHNPRRQSPFVVQLLQSLHFSQSLCLLYQLLIPRLLVICELDLLVARPVCRSCASTRECAASLVRSHSHDALGQIRRFARSRAKQLSSFRSLCVLNFLEIEESNRWAPPEDVVAVVLIPPISSQSCHFLFDMCRLTSLLATGHPTKVAYTNFLHPSNASKSLNSAIAFCVKTKVCRFGRAFARLSSIRFIRFCASRRVCNRGERGKPESVWMALSVKSMHSWSLAEPKFSMVGILWPVKRVALHLYQLALCIAYLFFSGKINEGILHTSEVEFALVERIVV